MMKQVKKLNNGENSQEETFKKLKNDNKLLENNLEQIQKEASKPSGVKIQVVEKEMKTYPIHITAQEDAI